MKPARLAVCQTTSERSTSRVRTLRACCVDTNMCGCSSTQRTEGGTGMRLIARVVDSDRQHESAEQRRRDVVGVARSARDGLARDGVRQQFDRPRAALEQRVGRDHGSDSRGRRSAEARSERECPSRSRARCRTAGDAACDQRQHRLARPCCAPASSGRSAAMPRHAADTHARLVHRARRGHGRRSRRMRDPGCRIPRRRCRPSPARTPLPSCSPCRDSRCARRGRTRAAADR